MHWCRVLREIESPGGLILGGEKARGESGVRLIGVRILCSFEACHSSWSVAVSVCYYSTNSTTSICRGLV